MSPYSHAVQRIVKCQYSRLDNYLHHERVTNRAEFGEQSTNKGMFTPDALRCSAVPRNAVTHPV